jgi:DNA polymerase-3 subunit gamma/tau
MGQALYRKYRSKSLDEIVGQEHITHTLAQALKSGRISHAYLFTGPRGVGKTSIARIWAHEINDIPYAEGQTNLDIIEIDAASNRRIDEIRDLRDKVYIAPAGAKYKVYIIDEVHMLTKEAFNALLKTLEEPPAHVVFILATTEAHKLPETIISRTQRFIFKPIETTKAVAHMRDIAKQEKIDITDDALALIAEHGDGSFRDSISLLDQASSHGQKIDLEAVQAMLGIPPQQAIDELAQLIQSPTTDVSQLIASLVKLYDQGFQASAIAKQLATALRQQMLARTLVVSVAAATAVLARLLDVPSSRDPERYLEIALIETLQTSNTQGAPQPPVRAKTAVLPPQAPELPKAEVATPTAPKYVAAATQPQKEAAAATTTEPADNTNIVTPGAEPLDEATWSKVLTSLKKHHNTLYGIARMAHPSLTESGTLELAFAFAFHQKRLHEAKNRQIISDAVYEITGKQIEISCIHDASLKDGAKPTHITMPAATTETAQATSEPLSAISNIFGGGELLQS